MVLRDFKWYELRKTGNKRKKIYGTINKIEFSYLKIMRPL